MTEHAFACEEMRWCRFAAVDYPWGNGTYKPVRETISPTSYGVNTLPDNDLIGVGSGNVWSKSMLNDPAL